MEIWKRFLMGRNELVRTKIETLNAVDETFMKSVDLERDLISEDNRSLTFFSELEKSISIKALGHKHNFEEPSDPNQKSSSFISKKGRRYGSEKHYVGKVRWWL